MVAPKAESIFNRLGVVTGMLLHCPECPLLLGRPLRVETPADYLGMMPIPDLVTNAGPLGFIARCDACGFRVEMHGDRLPTVAMMSGASEERLGVTRWRIQHEPGCADPRWPARSFCESCGALVAKVSETIEEVVAEPPKTTSTWPPACPACGAEWRIKSKTMGAAAGQPHQGTCASGHRWYENATTREGDDG